LPQAKIANKANRKELVLAKVLLSIAEKLFSRLTVTVMGLIPRRFFEMLVKPSIHFDFPTLTFLAHIRICIL
jgi:hypothetical protein